MKLLLKLVYEVYLFMEKETKFYIKFLWRQIFNLTNKTYYYKNNLFKKNLNNNFRI